MKNETTCIVDYWNRPYSIIGDSSGCTVEFGGVDEDKFNTGLVMRRGLLMEKYARSVDENRKKIRVLTAKKNQDKSLRKRMGFPTEIDRQIRILKNRDFYWMLPTAGEILNVVKEYLKDNGFSLKNSEYPRLYKKLTN